MAGIADGVRLLRAARYEEALSSFLSMEVATDEYPELSYYLGLSYVHLERYDEAVLYLEQVVTSEMGFSHIYQARMILGYIYATTQRYRLGEFEFSRLLEDGYESAKVYAALAFVVYKQKKIAPSIVHLEKALLIDSENANVLNSLGYIMAENNIQLEKAILYCQRALRQKPRNPAYLDSLGWACFKAGRVDDARLYLRKALEMAPGNPEIAEHLRLASVSGGR